MFQRRHYEFVANVIRSLEGRNVKQRVAEVFARKLAEDSSTFSRDRFLVACLSRTESLPESQPSRFTDATEWEREPNPEPEEEQGSVWGEVEPSEPTIIYPPSVANIRDFLRSAGEFQDTYVPDTGEMENLLDRIIESRVFARSGICFGTGCNVSLCRVGRTTAFRDYCMQYLEDRGYPWREE